MKYFDANSWIGRWPFSFSEAFTPKSLARHFGRHRIQRALVSPLDAVFAPEPGPANQALLRGTRGLSTLEPVPIINPGLGNWRDELSRSAEDSRVRAIRILPNYHNFRLTAAVMAEFVEVLVARKLRLLIQIRLIDERHEYHAMTLQPVRVKEFEAFLRRQPTLPVLASGLLRSEILPLVPLHANLLADLSFAEWHDTLPHLLAKVPTRQLVFASHTPLLITAAAVAKLETSEVAAAKLRAIAGENLTRFLGSTKA